MQHHDHDGEPWMKSKVIVPILFSCLRKLAWCATTPTPTPSPPSSSTHRRNFRSNPYDILHVDPTKCTQKEIQRQYRKLCLKHHPDKKKNRFNMDDDDEEEETTDEEDFEFKEVQHAYSLIGTEEDRRNYDLLQKYNNNLRASRTNNRDTFSRGSTTTTTTTNMNGWETRRENMMFGPSTIYFTFGDGLSFRFTNRRHLPSFYQHQQHQQGVRHPFDSDVVSRESNKRPHYIQRITIPLEVLYNGGQTVHLKLETSLVDRYRAAYNGGIFIPVLVQSSLTVLATWVRSQKINWLLSLFLFVSMIHINIPAPPTKVTFKTTIRKGWKGGTKIKYHTDEADITFILREGNHSTYTRVGNDLHTQVKVSTRQLSRGCTLTFPPIRESDSPIQLKLRRNEFDDGDTIRIKSCGWPIGSGKKNEFGDLLVKICCISRR